MDESIKIEFKRIATKYGLSPFYEDGRNDRVLLYKYYPVRCILVEFDPKEIGNDDFVGIENIVGNILLGRNVTEYFGENFIVYF